MPTNPDRFAGLPWWTALDRAVEMYYTVRRNAQPDAARPTMGTYDRAKVKPWNAGPAALLVPDATPDKHRRYNTSDAGRERQRLYQRRRRARLAGPCGYARERIRQYLAAQ